MASIRVPDIDGNQIEVFGEFVGGIFVPGQMITNFPATQAISSTDLVAMRTATGTANDAAITTDTSGTVSSKLRGLVKIFGDVWDSVGHRLKVDGSGVTQPVSGTVAVPGVAVATKQDTGNVHLETIATNTARGTQIDEASMPSGGVGLFGWLSATYQAIVTNGSRSGDTTDIAVTTDAVGTISGKLRGLVKILGDVWDSVGHRLKVDGSGVTQPVSGTVSVTGVATDTVVQAVRDRLPTALSNNNVRVSIQEGQITGFSTETTIQAVRDRIGALADTAWVSGSGSVIAILKNIATTLAGTLTTNLATTDRDNLAAVAVAAQDTSPAAVVGYTFSIAPSVTVSTTPAYSSGDVVAGKLTLTNAMRVTGGSGILKSLLVVDSSNQKAAFKILIFNSDPSAGTYTDNGAFSFHTTDRGKLVRKISVTPADYDVVNNVAVAEIDIDRPVVAVGSRHLYAVVVVDGSTPTYAATGDLILRFGFLGD